VFLFHSVPKIKEADDNDPLVGDFLKGTLKVGEFVAKAEEEQQKKAASEPPLVRLCNELKVMLSAIYPPDLSPKERFDLKSTHTVISEVLEEIATTKN
jgi:hypothetical protein